jgi:hypothetical protein
MFGGGVTSSSKHRVLNRGFPFSLLQCRQGRTRMDEWVVLQICVRCMQWLCCVLVVGKVWRIVPCVYKIYTLDRFQFHGLLVSFSSPTHAHTYPHTRTSPRAYARARTVAARQSVQSSLGGVSIPVVCVHDLAKRLEMHTIPDNPGCTLY